MLIHFGSIFYSTTQKTKDFLTFLGGIEIEYCAKMGKVH